MAKAQATGALSFGSRTDVGRVREHNEDNLLVKPPLFVVCDGMGGHEAGEVASEIAIDVIARHAPTKLDADALGQAVEEANLAIFQAVRAGQGKEGMGTTCTACMIQGTKLIIAQSGDSRAYLMHASRLQQLTRDHSLVQDLIESGEITPSEARTHPWRSYITRALGIDPAMRPDLYELKVSPGDRLLICSDGLYSMVEDAEIERILATHENPQLAADALVEAANERGGHDNITVIVVDLPGNPGGHKSGDVGRSKAFAVSLIGILVLIIALGAIALNFWMTNSIYLGEADGKVAIYRGMPDGMAGLSSSEIEEMTDIDIDDLQPGIAKRIQDEGIKCDSLDAAHSLIERYEDEIAQSSSKMPPDATSDPAAPSASAESQTSDPANTNESA